MFKSYFPLRWESTGDQWWYASPIDWAAANGHYDIVRELLYLDANLLIKLTSLRRIRRLETLWDDDARFADAARCRAFVARNLLLECETKNRNNTLLRAGYGGWLLYTAASAGDAVFVKELVDRDPLLVFGEGEYGVSDILYGAARSKNSEVFTRLLDCAMRPKGLVGDDDDDEEEEEEEEGLSRDGKVEVFRWEMVNRAVHAAARGGSLEVLRQLVSSGGCDVLTYRDAQGSTILHAASGKGQVEVANYLVSSFDIINSRDDQGNTALHIAAFRGHSSVVKALISAHPESSTIPNNAGDTFLHMAVAGFRTPGFRRLDRQMELMHHLVKGSTINIQEIINIKNNDGRTILHVAVTGNMHSDLVELLMTVQRIDLNIRDVNGMTPLDLLSRQPRSASSEILIKQLISAGGIFTPGNRSVVSAIASHLKMQSIGSSPGTNFKVSDAEIFLYTGIEAREQTSSCATSSKECSAAKKQNSINTAAKKLKLLLKWPLKKEKAETTPKKEHSVKRWSECEDTPTPLRQRFAKTSMLNSKRAFCVRSSSMPPSPATKKKFTAGLMHGVIQAMPSRTLSDSFSMSGMSTPTLEKEKDFSFGEEIMSASCSKSLVSGRSAEVMEKSCQRQDSVKNDNRLMNRYLCFGAQGLAVENSVRKQRRSGRIFKGSVISAA